MKIITEQSLREFNFWSGAESNVKHLTYSDLESLEEIITDIYSDGISETELNDLFWFDFDTVCDWIGESAEEVYKR
jgi:hypothetical protein